MSSAFSSCYATNVHAFSVVHHTFDPILYTCIRIFYVDNFLFYQKCEARLWSPNQLRAPSDVIDLNSYVQYQI